MCARHARRPKEVTVSVNYLVRIPIEESERIVGRAWEQEDAYLWECELDMKMRDPAEVDLPHLLVHADEPDIDVY